MDGVSFYCCQAMGMDRTNQGIVWTVVVAAGAGRRFGGAKQFCELAGVAVLDRAVLGAAKHSTGVVVVVPPAKVGECSERFAALTKKVGAGDKVEWRVAGGGETRSASVRRGLSIVAPDAEVVLVHDAARPLASDALFVAVIEAIVAGADAAVPVLEVTDTVRFRSGDAIDRAELVALQTPQAFRAELLRRVHEGCPEATDDVSLVFDVGGNVEFVVGERRNLKLTTPDDFVLAELLFADGSGS